MKRNFETYDLLDWRKRHKLSQGSCANILCTNDRTIREWETKKQVPGLVKAHCRLLDVYMVHMGELVATKR